MTRWGGGGGGGGGGDGDITVPFVPRLDPREKEEEMARSHVQICTHTATLDFCLSPIMFPTFKKHIHI